MLLKLLRDDLKRLEADNTFREIGYVGSKLLDEEFPVTFGKRPGLAVSQF